MCDSACKHGKRNSKLRGFGGQVQVGIFSSLPFFFFLIVLSTFKVFGYNTFFQLGDMDDAARDIDSLFAGVGRSGFASRTNETKSDC